MKTLHKRCAGLDVHKTEVVACLRVANRGKASYELRRFPTTTRGLIELGDWLEQAGCTHVAMEATGVYWKPVWYILEGRFQQILANAAHTKAVPGRKSDTHDATWISDLLAHGLIRAELRAAPAHPGSARSDAAQEATHARDRAAHPAHPGRARGSQYQAHVGHHRHLGYEWAAHLEGHRGWRDRPPEAGRAWRSSARRNEVATCRCAARSRAPTSPLPHRATLEDH